MLWDENCCSNNNFYFCTLSFSLCPYIHTHTDVVIFLLHINICTVNLSFKIKKYYFRGRGSRAGWRERDQFVVVLIYAFIGCFLCEPWLRIEPATLVYPDDALIHWAAQPGPLSIFLLNTFHRLYDNWFCFD